MLEGRTEAAVSIASRARTRTLARPHEDANQVWDEYVMLRVACERLINGFSIL